MHRFMARFVRASSVVGALACSIGVIPAQGSYVNFEPPAVKPITVAKIGYQNYLLV